MPSLRLLFVLLPASLLACAASAEDDASGTAAGATTATIAKTSIERRLSPPVAIPTATPVGRSVDDVVAELGRGLRALEPRVGASSTVTRWVDAEGREVFHREVTEDADIVRVGYRGPSDIDAIYADHSRSNPNAPGILPKDGRVDAYRGAGFGTFTSLEDQDRDGKVDLAIEPAPADVDLTPYGAVRLSPGGSVANRIFEDRDHDGRFEVESLTAKASTSSWFLLDAPEP